MSRLPKGTDADLTARLHEVHAGSAFFPKPDRRLLASTFAVRHYAGDVTYTVDGFLSKNNDTVSNDLTELCRSSSQPLLHQIFAAREVRSDRGSSLAHNELMMSSPFTNECIR